MKVSTLLEKAKAKLDTPEKWTQGADAVDENGSIVSPASPKAKKWCARGAIRAFRTDPGTKRSAENYLDLNVPCLWSILSYNDGPATYEGILATFDRAIQNAIDSGE